MEGDGRAYALGGAWQSLKQASSKLEAMKCVPSLADTCSSWHRYSRTPRNPLVSCLAATLIFGTFTVHSPQARPRR